MNTIIKTPSATFIIPVLPQSEVDEYLSDVMPDEEYEQGEREAADFINRVEQHFEQDLLNQENYL